MNCSGSRRCADGRPRTAPRTASRCGGSAVLRAAERRPTTREIGALGRPGAQRACNGAGGRGSRWAVRRRAARALMPSRPCSTWPTSSARPNPGPELPALLDHVEGCALPVRAAEPVQPVEAVSLLSPHQALGRDWDTGHRRFAGRACGPTAIPRGGSVEHGASARRHRRRPDEVSARAPVLADERRLLIAAMGRARRRLLVTASRQSDGGDDGDYPAVTVPTRRWRTSPPIGPRASRSRSSHRRVLSPPAVVGRLRATGAQPRAVSR